MSIAFALLAAHMLADFPFQTDNMAAKKFDNIFVRAQHCTVHFIFAFLLTLPYGLETALSAAVLLTPVHFVIDIQRWAEPKNGFELYPVAVDQSLHVASIYVVSLVVMYT